MVERESGKVAAVNVENVQRDTLMPHVIKRVLPSATIYTDEYPSYKALKRNGFLDHEVITHKTGVYVSGDVHTNTVEGFWSLVKRGISGTHHQVSAKHLQGYLNEYVWRYNNRDEEGPALFARLLVRAAFTRGTGATITHHHAVGTDHRPWMTDEVGPLGAEVLRAVKQVLDPAGVLNPGKTIPS